MAGREIKRGPKKDFVTDVVDSLIERLKEGTAPWQKPWNPDLSTGLPINATTGNRYRGINSIMLSCQGRQDARWMTFVQAKEKGWHVKKGESGTQIQYWKTHEERVVRDTKGKPVLDENGETKKVRYKLERPRVFYSNVFNAEQIDGIPAVEKKEISWNPIERAEAILKKSEAVIEPSNNDRAYYSPLQDVIRLPRQEQFDSAGKYYGVALHELGHWTGHESRLNRDLANPFGSQEYAKEELRAEIASMVLGQELHIGHDTDQNVAYVASWIKVLQEDPLELFRAATDAEKICDLVLSYEQVQEISLTNNEDIGVETSLDSKDIYLVEGTVKGEGKSNDIGIFKDGYLDLIHQGGVSIRDDLKVFPSLDSAMEATKNAHANGGSLGALIEGGDRVDLSVIHVDQHGVRNKIDIPSITRIYLEVPFEDKETAKSLGAKWDGTEKSWYYEELSKEKFEEWAKNPLKKISEARVVGAEWNKDREAWDNVGRAKDFEKWIPKQGAAIPREQSKPLATPEKEELNRKYLAVPYKERLAAKSLGAKWDKAEKSWFVDKALFDSDSSKFSQWSNLENDKKPVIDSKEQSKPLATPEKEELNRKYLAVPYGEHLAAKNLGAKWDKAEKSWFVDKALFDSDSSKFSRWSNLENDETPAIDPREEFRQALVDMGCDPNSQGKDHPIMDGTKQRIAVVDDKKTELSGFYIGHLDGHPAGYIKNHRTNSAINWKSKGYSLSTEEKATLNAVAAEKKNQRIAEELKTQEATAKRVAEQLKNLKQVDTPTPYMSSKGIQCHKGTFTDEEQKTTYLPIVDVEGKQWSMAYIKEDGTKRYAKEGKKEGCFHAVGNGFNSLKDSPALILSEGYSTAATITQAVGFTTVAVFDSGNLPVVAKQLRANNPDKPIIICGDDDLANKEKFGVNPGRVKAEEAAREVGGIAIFPIFAPGEQKRTDKNFTDFNDLAEKSLLGKEGVKFQVEAVVKHELAKLRKKIQEKQQVEKQAKKATVKM